MSPVVRRFVSQHPHWKILVVVCVAIPAFVAFAVYLFAWPSANLSPRNLPVGVVGTTVSTDHVASFLQHDRHGEFDLRLYADEEAARAAIRDRDVYGAFTVSDTGVRVLGSSAASPTVARLLDATAAQLARQVRGSDAGPTGGASGVDVVAAGPDDPQELGLSAAILPLSICSIIIAAVVALLLEFRPAWRMIGSLVMASAFSGLAAYLVAGRGLDAMPAHGFAATGVLALLVLAMSSTAAGLASLMGTGGLGIAALLMVFVGNPFSGSTSAPELLPTFAHDVGRHLPPGAGASLLRSVVYFDGHGSTPSVAALLAWTAVGFATIVSGHHSFVGFAARRHAARLRAADEASSQLLVPTGAQS